MRKPKGGHRGFVPIIRLLGWHNVCLLSDLKAPEVMLNNRLLAQKFVSQDIGDIRICIGVRK